MNAILDAVKRLRTGLVLSAAMLATGCAEKADEPFVDPEFDLILFQYIPPPCDCGELVERFGGPIRFDAEQGSWRLRGGPKVDLADRAKTEFPDYHGDVTIQPDPDATFTQTIEAFASLGDAGICEFFLDEAKGVREGNVERPISFEGEGYLIYLIAYRRPNGGVMLCQEGKEPKPASPGYSKHSAFCTLNRSSTAKIPCV